MFFTVRTRLIWLILLSMALGAALAVVAPALVAQPQGPRRVAGALSRQAGPARMPDALGDPLGRLVGEREPRRASPAAAAGEEVRAANERHARPRSRA